ncbi:hypothetical protein OV450_6820, partial [Actinobacteria bacterium OV450]
MAWLLVARLCAGPPGSWFAGLPGELGGWVGGFGGWLGCCGTEGVWSEVPAL